MAGVGGGNQKGGKDLLQKNQVGRKLVKRRFWNSKEPQKIIILIWGYLAPNSKFKKRIGLVMEGRISKWLAKILF